MIPRTAIPKGVRVFTPEETAQRRVVEARLLSVFHRWGFREIITPTFEYLEVFEQPTAEDAGDQIFKFVDRQSGRLLALRVDITPQVARLVATTLRQAPLPLRLAYAATVFRYHEPRAGRQREFEQVGVELLGLELPEADAEMIAMAVEGCQAVGLDAFQIDVGQVEVVRGLLNALQPPVELRARLVSAIRRKDPLELELLLREAPADPALKDAILALPRLYGGREILDQAGRLAFPPPSRVALANLAEVVTILENYGLAEHVILDLAETHDFEYYTGVVFGAFSRGLGYQLASGGRYDHLIGQFGYPCAATGFTFDLERVMAALTAGEVLPQVTGPDVLVIDFSTDKRAAHRLARLLRDRGISVARDIIKRDLAGSLDYARQSAIKRAVILGSAEQPPDTVLIHELTTGGQRTLPLEDVVRAIAQGDSPWPI
ncbi:MAG TPA: ATP phosphoribosyltransferase regulatory subunit [Candidatus Methylomirabilis sp.]|nr:ATP phosphoribosyltransferase regulatory subunit [Candidatus Methylomirabilis sp.]